jgi:hypothetical protein
VGKFILIILLFVAAVSVSSAFGDSNNPGFTNAVNVSNFGDNSTTLN